MKNINLQELYPDVYTTDFFVDVTEEVMETIRAAERAEAAYERKMYRYMCRSCGKVLINILIEMDTKKRFPSNETSISILGC